jgi:hypothetical protein
VTPGERTLAERMATMDAALLVRVLSPGQSRAIDLRKEIEATDPGLILAPIIVVHTAYDVEVIDVLTGHERAVSGGRLRIATWGGRATWDETEIVSPTRVPQLVAGATYAVFLTGNDSFSRLTFLDGDVYRLDGARVELNSAGAQTAYGQSISGLTSEDALTLLRAAAETLPK